MAVAAFGVFAADEVVCPPEGTHFFPHETDCSKYYECSEGEKFLFVCGDGLHFNPVINNCDYPEHAGCDPNSIKCAEDAPQFSPHPTDCSKYVECVNGIADVLSCGEGLLWNQSILGCDYPENVDCKTETS